MKLSEKESQGLSAEEIAQIEGRARGRYFLLFLLAFCIVLIGLFVLILMGDTHQSPEYVRQGNYIIVCVIVLCSLLAIALVVVLMRKSDITFTEDGITLSQDSKNTNSENEMLTNTKSRRR